VVCCFFSSLFCARSSHARTFATPFRVYTACVSRPLETARRALTKTALQLPSFATLARALRKATLLHRRRRSLWRRRVRLARGVVAPASAFRAAGCATPKPTAATAAMRRTASLASADRLNFDATVAAAFRKNGGATAMHPTVSTAATKRSAARTRVRRTAPTSAVRRANASRSPGCAMENPTAPLTAVRAVLVLMRRRQSVST
jgi:hypothetical protein